MALTPESPRPGWPSPANDPGIEIGRLYAKLRQSFASPDQLSAWLKAPNPAFGGSQPIQVIERGEVDRVWRMIYFLDSGSPV